MRNNTSWLQHIPKHWEVKRLKDVVSCNDDVLPDNLNANSTIQYIEISDVDSDKGITNVSNISFGEAPSRARRITKKGDIVVSTVRTYLKAIATIHDDDLIVSTGFAVLRPNPTIISSFLHYAILNEYVLDDIIKNSTGVSYPAIQSSKLIAMPIPLPPLSEQEKIARYLDTKVGEIDQKVSLIEKKIEHYQLLKKSIINKVVTKGLHPEAPLKDSQISWLGQIPEHWEVKRFKSIARTIKGKVVEYFDTPSDDANIVLTVDTLRNDNPQFLNYAVTSDTDQLCKVNDIIVIWDGAGVGEFLRAKEGLISSTTARIDVNKSIVNKDYFWYFGDKIEEIMKHMPTGMGIPHLNPIILSNMQFTLPPLSEQQEIVSYLDQRCADIDAIIANCTAQIEKYKTLKRALINEVVTGQRTIE